jgi:thiamine-phosphate pyrophosphorylase
MIEFTDPRLRLCAITDDLRDGVAGLVSRAEAVVRGGATMVLLRLKHADARTLVEVGRALVAALTVPVVISERLDVALACGAAGVHLNAHSMPVVAIRPQVSDTFLIGGSISTADDLLRTAACDFVTIGPVFSAGDESLDIEGFRRLARASGRPAIAIGGIHAANADSLRAAGAVGVAAIRALFAAPDPVAAAQAFLGTNLAAPIRVD